MYLHRDVSHTDMLQLHFISCRGVSGAGGNMCGSRDFCQSYIVLNLFYGLQRGSNGFIAEKNYIYTLPRIQRGSIISRGGWGGGGVSNFFQGVQMLISKQTDVRTCYIPGGCPDPLSPSGSAHGQCHQNGAIFITVPLLTIIVRHWFVRINDRWGYPNDALVLRTFDTFEKHSSWKW